MANKQSFLEKCYKDNEGKVTILQSPNTPLIIWIVMTVTGRLIGGGLLKDVVDLVAFGAVFTWAWLELFQGDNYFRRVLGLIVLVAAVTNRVN